MARDEFAFDESAAPVGEHPTSDQMVYVLWQACKLAERVHDTMSPVESRAYLDWFLNDVLKPFGFTPVRRSKQGMIREIIHVANVVFKDYLDEEQG